MRLFLAPLTAAELQQSTKKLLKELFFSMGMHIFLGLQTLYILQKKKSNNLNH